MRNPRNETLGRQKSPKRGPGGSKSTPARTCVLSRVEAPQERLIRLALSPDGEVLPDIRAKAPGRGAWIGVDRAALESAQSNGKLRGALRHAFKGSDVTIPDNLGELIGAALERQALDQLGLEARAGHLITGSDKIRDAAQAGNVRLLIHAADAAEDGCRKLDQAWRVGSDDEGSGARGLVIPAGRAILSAALGRENAVHAAIVDERAALRVSGALSRWMDFLGPSGRTDPCGKRSQGTLGSEGVKGQE